MCAPAATTAPHHQGAPVALIHRAALPAYPAPAGRDPEAVAGWQPAGGSVHFGVVQCSSLGCRSLLWLLAAAVGRNPQGVLSQGRSLGTRPPATCDPICRLLLRSS